MQLIKQKEHAYSVIQNQQQQGQDRTARQVISWSFFFVLHYAYMQPSHLANLFTV